MIRQGALVGWGNTKAFNNEENRRVSTDRLGADCCDSGLGEDDGYTT